VNVSLDSLDAERFARVTRGGRLSDVLAGIEAAAAAGLTPVKVNVVVARGLNDDELPRFAELALRMPVDVRFIERMPVGELAALGAFMSEAEMRTALSDYALEDLPHDGAPARRVRIRRGGACGTLGFISAMSRPFCAGCDRLRLTSEGRLRACLFERAGIDVRTLLRQGGSDGDLRDAFFAAASLRRPGMHGAQIDSAAMSAIGG
jgi:GTP 3',8-cyclase